MAFDVGSVVAHIKADLSNFENGMKQADASISRFKGGMEAVGNAISTVGKQAAVMTGLVAAGVGVIVKNSIDTAGQLEQTQIAFNTLLKDEQKTSQAIADIKKDAQKSTLFGFNDLAKANQLLISAGANTADARTNINALSDAISATGGGSAELSRLAVNLQQIKALGKASALDIKQFAFAGINIYQLLADSTGKSVEQVREMEVSYEDLTGALQKATKEGGMFAGAAAAQSKSLKGLYEGLKDTINLTLADVAVQTGLFQAVKNGIQFVGEQFDKLVPKAIQFGQFISKVGEAINEAFASGDTGIIRDILNGGEDSQFASILETIVGALMKLSAWVQENQELVMTFLKGLAIAMGALLIIGTITALVMALTNPLVLLGLAIATLFTIWQTNFWGIRDITMFVVNFVVDFFMNTLLPAIQAFGVFFNEQWLFISLMLQGVWDIMIGIIQLAWGIIYGFLAAGLELMAGDWQGAWDRIKQGTSIAWEGLKRIFQGMLEFLLGWGGSVVSNLVRPFEDAWNRIRDFVNKIKDNLDFTKRHSPSVVDIVYKGVREVNRALSGLETTSSFTPQLAGIGATGGTTNNSVSKINIDMNGAVIADQASALRVGELIGDSIIRKLQHNVRF